MVIFTHTTGMSNLETVTQLLMLQLILQKNQIKSLKNEILGKYFEMIRCSRHRYEDFSGTILLMD